MNKNLLILGVVLLNLNSCTNNGHRARIYDDSEFVSSKLAGDYLYKFNNNQDQSNLLDAAEAYLDGGAIDRAEFTLSSIKIDNLTENQLNTYLFLRAKVSIGSKDYDQALENLDSIGQNSKISQNEIEELRDTTYELLNKQQERSLAKILNNLAQDSDSEKWHDIIGLSKEKLTSIYNKNSIQQNNEIAGWVKLALIVKDDADDNLQDKIRIWQQEYPNHPGNKRIKKYTDDDSEKYSLGAKKISLLLPLSGEMHDAGEAIEAGFLSAYYNDKDLNKPEIDVINTEKQESITSIYDEALSHNADIIVGPLGKKNVDNLAHRFVLQKPTIALNYSDKEPKKNNLLQFGLSSSEEAKQVAYRMHKKNYKRVLVLAPDTDWGHKMETAFSSKFTELKGNIVEDKFYTSEMKEISKDIQKILKVDDSKDRKLNLQYQIGKLQFTPRRRQDIDAIFIAAKPQYARQLNSLIKFYYADDVPIYSTSSIFSGENEKKFDRDLDGIIFCDMPWILQENYLDLKDNLEKNQNYKSYYKRLHALGVDSYRISKKLNNLYYVAKLGYNGTSGRLFVNENNQIERQLIWAQINNGTPQIIN